MGRLADSCVYVCAPECAYASVDCIYTVYILYKRVDLYGKLLGPGLGGVFTRSFCACMSVREGGGRQSVCACHWGSIARVSAPREADVSDVRRQCQSRRTLEGSRVSRCPSCSV